MTEDIRVLLADDHDVVRRGLTALLDGASGFAVVGAASDGKEAVAEPRVTRGIVGIGGEDFLIGALEDGLIELLAGRTERGGRDAAFLRQRQKAKSPKPYDREIQELSI